jgi:hypothetical protein
MSYSSALRLVVPVAFTALLLGYATPWAAAESSTQATAKTVVAKSGTVVKAKGKLEKGAPVDLAWAAKSSVACFPATRFEHFDGNHVFFKTHLPAGSVLKIRAVPTKSDVDISLYAYSGPVDLPPNVNSVVSCEASYGTKQMNKPYNPGEAEAVELNATTNPYDVIIGVAGARKLAAGDFTLELDLTTAPAAPTGKITQATPIVVERGKSASVSGKIDAGKEIALTWAANSSVACFPATATDHFNGTHVLYSFDLPKYTTATVELTPQAATADLSLYGYSVGTTSNAMPPDVPSVVSCEASYGTNNINNRYNPGGAEKIELVAINNPYKAFIGVAGAQGTKQGAFTLKVTLTPR